MSVRAASASDRGVAVLDLALGLGLAAGQAGGRAARLGMRLLSPVAPLVRRAPALEQYWPMTAARGLSARGRQQREALTAALVRVVRGLVPQVLDFVLDEVNLTHLVRARVDLDEVARGLDLDAAAARIDIDAILSRVDLIALAEYVIDGVDLPAIIRESTGSMASEGIRGVRMQTISADERVNRLVDRVLLRRQARQTEAQVGAARPPSPNGGQAP